MEYITLILNNILDFILKIDAVVALVIGYFFAKRQFKFESVHKRRLEIIEEGYEKLVLTNLSFRSLTAPLQDAGEPSIQDKEKDFVNKANDMIKFLDTKKIFFNSEEQNHINLIKGKLFQTWGDYRYKKDIENDPVLMKERTDLYKKNWAAASEEIPKLISSLELNFKKELGLK